MCVAPPLCSSRARGAAAAPASDFDMEDVAKHCDSLTTLILRSCRLINDAAARHVTRLARRKASGGLPPITVLDIGGYVRAVYPQ